MGARLMDTYLNAVNRAKIKLIIKPDLRYFSFSIAPFFLTSAVLVRLQYKASNLHIGTIQTYIGQFEGVGL
jgi:hypothetical protein